MNKFLNKPWTWGTYLKLCVVSLIVTFGYVEFFTKHILGYSFIESLISGFKKDCKTNKEDN